MPYRVFLPGYLPTPHRSTATARAFEQPACSPQSLLCLVTPCYFGCFTPATAARSANNNANVFLYSFHVPAHSLIRWQTVFPQSVSPSQIKPSFRFCHLTAQSTTLLSSTVLSKLSLTGL